MVPNTFHGEEIKPILDHRPHGPCIKKSCGKKAETIGQTVRPIVHQRIRESELGDLVADAMKKATGADIAYMNPGGCDPRSNGKITYGDAFEPSHLIIR
jgi:hypothetical protein